MTTTPSSADAPGPHRQPSTTAVLLVDDRPENLLAFEAALEPLALEVVCASSPIEALRLATAREFAVILLDVQMPGMDGYEVARRIKAFGRPRLTPIIFVTALDRDRRRVHTGYESGAVDYLFKPLDADELRAKVQAFVRLHDEREAEEWWQRRRYADLVEATDAARDAAALENGRRAAELLERIGDAYLALDREFRIVGVNPAAERMLAKPREELVGRSHWDVFPASAANDAGRAYRRVAAERVEQHLAQHYAAEGYDLHVEIDAYPAEDGGVAIFLRDVTERVRAEAALRASEARYRALFESIDAGFSVIEMVLDAAGTPVDYRFVETNPSFVHQTGLVEAVGRTARELVPGLESHWIETYGRVADTGESARFQSGSAAMGRWFDVFAFRMGPAERRRVALLFTDITEARIAEREREQLMADLRSANAALLAREASLEAATAQLAERTAVAEAAQRAAEAAKQAAEEANRVKSEFLAVMSHELRTPLNAIAGYAQLIELEVHGPVTPEQRHGLERIQRSQRHLLGLIDDVLNFAKLEAGHVEYVLADVPVRAAVDALEPLVAPQLEARRLRFERSGCIGDLAVRADPDKLRQILVNLLSNAIKFTDVGGAVTVRCEAGAVGTVRVIVSDTGIGIRPDRFEQIFAPFVQVERRLNAPQEGTGLGLAISRDLARGMGGDVTVESAVGQGSTFIVTLPGA